MPKIVKRVKSPGISRNAALQNLQQGSHGRSGEVISYSLYDTMTIAAAVANYEFFATPLGQGVPAKDKADTNNVLAGVMPAGQRITVDRLGVMLNGDEPDITATTLDAVFDMIFDTTLEFLIPGKDNLGLWTLAELFGITFQMAKAVTQYGPEPRFTGVYRLRVPIILAAQTPFQVRLQHHKTLTAYTDDMRIKLILAGTLERLS